MPSTAAITQGTYAGFALLPGLQVSPYGAVIRDLKLYAFGVTSTNVITATSTAITYTVSGLTTNDIPFLLEPSTGVSPVNIGQMVITASSQLIVQWTQHGTSTSGIPGLAAPGAAYTLGTLSYQTQSSSTTT